MDLHWRKISDQTGIDHHFEIEISNAPKPTFRLIAGAELKFKIVKGSTDVLWGRIASDYYGCWALRGRNHWTVDDMPVPPITSSTVEESKLHHDRVEFWFKHFLKELKQSTSSFLSDGTWELTQGVKREIATDREDWRRVDDDLAMNNQQPIWLDWDFGNALKVIRLKGPQDANAGRIKWWKKKVAEGSCPPILTWFVSALDALVVVDGHDRLSAFEALNIRPQCLIINSVRKEPRLVNKAMQKGIMDGLSKRNLNPERKGLTVERLNNLLLEAFDDRPFRRPITKSNGVAGLSDSWREEVSNFKQDSSIDQEELEAMLIGD